MAVNNISKEAIEKLLQIIIDVENSAKADANSKLDATLKGVANGLAELDASGKVPATQLPSYVDDVVEGYFYNSKFYKESAHTTEIVGEASKIYMDLGTNKIYRWSGTAFVVVSETLALGETSSTAYRGDRGKTAYDHSQIVSGNPHKVTKAEVGLGNVENKSAATILAELASKNVTDALGYTPTKAPTVAGTSGQVLKLDASGNPVWGADNNTTYSNMTGATTSAAGASGLVPAPSAGDATRYLRSDGTWVVPPDTKYTHPTTSGNNHIPSGGASGQILRWSKDGVAVWGADNNTTYTTGTASTSGITKLYTATGTATDGAMTQAAVNTALAGKVNTSDVTEVTAANIETWYAALKA